MMKSVNNYGNDSINRLLAVDILQKSDLSEMDIEIFLLRYGYDWYFEDIGTHIGNKYRGKPYTEGAIRYRTKLIKQSLQEFLIKMNQIDTTLR